MFIGQGIKKGLGTNNNQLRKKREIKALHERFVQVNGLFHSCLKKELEVWLGTQVTELLLYKTFISHVFNEDLN